MAVGLLTNFGVAILQSSVSASHSQMESVSDTLFLSEIRKIPPFTCYMNEA